MFKFNFDSESSGTNDSESPETGEHLWHPFKEVSGKGKITLSKDSFIKVACRDFVFQVVDVTRVCETLQKEGNFNDTIFKSLQISHSDLLPAKYEGGFKIWECTYDLLHYLIDNNIDLRNKSVLDLGCGVGLLGMYSLQKGATVHFQDYNIDVLEYTTVPSVFCSCSVSSECRFFAGDWRFFCEEDPSMKYDLIFSTETIYNPKNYDKLCAVFEKKLKPGGVGYLGAKSFYFGVGGSTLEFRKKLDARGKLDSSICWKFSDGLQREILKISLKN